MAHAIAGHAGSATVAGGAINFKLTEWTWELKVETAEDTACGDVFLSRVPTFADWEAEIVGEVPDQAARHFFSANEANMRVPATIAITLKHKSGDTNPIFSATGICTSLRQEKPLKEAMTFRATIIGSEGTAPDLDTTPTA